MPLLFISQDVLQYTLRVGLGHEISQVSNCMGTLVGVLSVTTTSTTIPDTACIIK